MCSITINSTESVVPCLITDTLQYYPILRVALMIAFFSSFKIFLLINNGTIFSVLVNIGFKLNLLYYCDLMGNA